MATQIKKATSGPLTGAPEGDPGVAITFLDGTVKALRIADLSQDVITRLAVHGLSQKLGDSYASASNAENPGLFAKARVDEVIAQLKAGDWRVVGEAGPRETLLARALARATGQSLEAAIEVLANKQAELDNEEKKLADNPWKQWRKTIEAQPAIKQAMADIKLEDAKAAAEKAKGTTATATTDLGALFA